MGGSINGGTPKSSILVGCSIINHLFWRIPMTMKTPYGYERRNSRGASYSLEAWWLGCEVLWGGSTLLQNVTRKKLHWKSLEHAHLQKFCWRSKILPPIVWSRVFLASPSPGWQSLRQPQRTRGIRMLGLRGMWSVILARSLFWGGS